MQCLAKTAVPQYSQHTKYELWAEMEKKMDENMYGNIKKENSIMKNR